MDTAFGQVLDSIWALLKYDPRAPLIFSSGLFLFLFAGFTFFYKFMRNNVNLRIVYVLLFSLYFYYKSSGLYFLILLFVATTDYFIAHKMERTENRTVRRWLVALSVFVNLGFLVYFKYTNFFIGLANDMFGKDFLSFQNIFLPVGISFFVFQSMSYTIDVYRRQLKPLSNWIDYAFYLSFFPQLVAGPIVRARDFIPQIRQRPLVVTREMFGAGMFLVITGLFKKAIISDYISLNFVDRIFDNPLLYSGFENLMGVFGYAMQIYCDFSGYSDMAIGIALLLGFKFNRNFDSPYKSATITEFWRRWHISLSSWLKDYLYISLGGNRKGKARTYLNLIITMVLGGLWHGAALRFVLWGALHGVALAIHKLFLGLFPRLKKSGMEMKRGWRIVGIVFTFLLVCFGWIFFRAPNMEVAGQMLGQIFTNFRIDLIPDVIGGYAGVFGLIALGYILHFTSARLEDRTRERVARMPIWALALLVVAVVWIVMQVKSSEIQPFIYFQF
ncbi:MBOAT family protein [Alistipes sp. OttesenSCG-928-B03]|nr:MBOAT family protein [Alistipes sp. OttesenSCG-928-B03]